MDKMINQWMVMIVAFIFVLVVGTLVLIDIAHGHEGNGWKHMSGNSGPIIGSMHCGLGISVWFQDMDEDGELDKCTLVLLDHGKFHVAPAEMTMTEATEYESAKPTCSCRLIEEGL